MSTSALVVRRGLPRGRAALAAEAAATRAVGATVVDQPANGTLIRGDDRQYKALEAQGFRVHVYRDTHLVRLANVTIDVAAPPVLTGPAAVPAARSASWPHHVVQFAGPPLPEWIAALERAGLEVVGKLADYAVLAIGAPDALAVVAAAPGTPITWTSPLAPAWRIHRALAGAAGVVRNLRAVVYPPEHADDVAAAIVAAGGTVVARHAATPGMHGEPAHVLAEVPAAAIADLAGEPYVLALEYAGPQAGLDGERDVQILAEGWNAAAPPNTATVVGYQAFLANLGVDGTGVTVAICDTGVDANANNNASGHIDLRGRQVAFVDHSAGAVATDTDGHGTHVAGIAVGSGASGQTEGAAPNNFRWGLGAAPGASYVSQNGTQVAPWPPAFNTLTAPAVNNGATIQNNSWWDTSTFAPNPGGYTANARAYDQLVRDADPASAAGQPLAVVFSAGNWGGAPSTLSPPHECKNPIVVGNSLTARPGALFPGDDVRGLSGSSSRGPALDGRTLPTVVAPGTNISSTWSETGSVAIYGNPIAGTGVADPANPGNLLDQYVFMSGTSMAAPHVAGACALLTQWWRARTGGDDPSPAMLKALLINGAEDLVGGQNWRRVRGERWVVHAGTTFRCNNLGFVPTQVVDGNTAVVAAANLAAVQATAGRWWYDAVNDVLYVRRASDAAPGNNLTALDAQAIANVPNNDQGWGRVSLPNMMLQAPASDRGPKLVSDQRHAVTANGQDVVFRVAPQDTTRPLRVTLVWTDAPGVVGAGAALRNNLNLEVTEVATATVLRGNVFANGFSAAGGGFDALNNVECVYRQAPAGVYEVRVIGANVTANARPPFDNIPWQDFALVIDNGEFADADPVACCVCLDRSGSMVSAGYVDTTRTATRAFVDLLGVDDRVAVVSFGTTASKDYPAGATAEPIVGAVTRSAAKQAIDALGFGGCTYMGDGIAQAGATLAGLTTPRAIVLFSDGYDNQGCDAGNPAKPTALAAAGALPAEVDLYTCAMGPLSDQALLEQLADLTGGRYYYMPTIDDLYEIYNFIRGQVTSTGLIVNDSATASRSRIGAVVDATASQVTFVIAWGAPELRWGPGAPRGDGQISVRLRGPDGKLLAGDDAWVQRRIGDGYVTFQLDEPAPGQWYVEVETARAEHTRYTVGGFVRSPIRLALRVPDRIRLDRPFELVTQVFDGARPLPRVAVDATCRSPRIGVHDLVRQLGPRLATVQPDDALIADGVPLDLARLVTLRRTQLAAGQPDLLAHTSRRLAARPQATDPRRPLVIGPRRAAVADLDLELARLPLTAGGLDLRRLARIDPGRLLRLGGHRAPITVTAAGSHNLRVTVRGEAGGTRFVRTDLVSVVAS